MKNCEYLLMMVNFNFIELPTVEKSIIFKSIFRDYKHAVPNNLLIQFHNCSEYTNIGNRYKFIKVRACAMKLK